MTCVDGRRLERYPGGRLASCEIARPHRFEGRVCEAPARVEFEQEGRLRRCVAVQRS